MKKSMGILCAVLFIFTISETKAFSLHFYISPGPNPTGDINFQNAALALGSSNFLIEEDFQTKFSDPNKVDIFSMGPITLDISRPGFSNRAEITVGAFGGAPYGTVSGNAIVNYDSGNPSDTLRIDFSGGLVQGFGLWIYDDWTTPDAYELIAWTKDGVMGSSAVLDADPGGTDDIVEGFVGVTATSGIDYVIVKNALNHSVPFELDHFQVVVNPNPNPVPEPATMLLLGSGLVGLAGLRRKFKNR